MGGKFFYCLVWRVFLFRGVVEIVFKDVDGEGYLVGYLCGREVGFFEWVGYLGGVVIILVDVLWVFLEFVLRMF